MTTRAVNQGDIELARLLVEVADDLGEPLDEGYHELASSTYARVLPSEYLADVQGAAGASAQQRPASAEWVVLSQDEVREAEESGRLVEVADTSDSGSDLLRPKGSTTDVDGLER